MRLFGIQTPGSLRFLTVLRSAKVWLVMIALSATLIVGGFHIGDRYGLLIGFFLALGLNAFVIFYDDFRLNALFPSSELEGQDPWGLLRMSRELAKQIGVRKPSIRLIESPTPLAFSTGLLHARACLFLSTSLVEKLSSDETRAVIAYELTRMKMQQTRAATAAAALAGIVALSATALDRVLMVPMRWITKKSPLRWGPLMNLASPLITILVRVAISRRAILDVDRITAETLGDATILARTLWKLDAYNKTRPMDISLSEAHLFTVDPLASLRWTRLAAVHPTVERRVRELTGRFPL